MAERSDAYVQAEGITRSEALRQLVELGLKASGKSAVMLSDDFDA
jgi:hypothetical protein